ncbi:MAG TPA: penicillin acylase family protein, partial [Arenicellales bacterium]|nr:penicillin acylase family protein [Arenicellales bacterium]
STDLPLDGGPDILRAFYARDYEDDGRLAAQAGDSFVMFVDWAPDGTLTSESIHQFGSATLDESSPHYADQAPPFAEMKMKPVYFEEEDLEPHIQQRYRPGLLPEPAPGEPASSPQQSG